MKNLKLICCLLFLLGFFVPPLFAADDEPIEAQARKNPKFTSIFNLADETKAMSDLRQIATGVAVLANIEELDSNGRPVNENITFDKLVSRQLIPKALLSGKNGKYQYAIKKVGYEFNVYADPIDPKSSLRHFMIDKDGTMYAERGKPVAKDSPRL